MTAGDTYVVIVVAALLAFCRACVRRIVETHDNGGDGLWECQGEFERTKVWFKG